MSGRLAAAALAAMVLASCAAPESTTTSSGTAITLQNAGFEEAARPGEKCAIGWSCAAHADVTAFRFFHEDGGYCIESLGQQPWAKVTQGVGRDKAKPVPGAHVRLSLDMKLESVAPGTAGPVIMVQGGAGQVLRAANNLKGAMTGVQHLEVDMELPPEAFVIEVGVLFEGKDLSRVTGKACFDHARLEITAPAAGRV
jgi:hypothetical protein